MRCEMIDYDESEFQDGFTAHSLLLIESLLGKDVAILLYGKVVPIDVQTS